MWAEAGDRYDGKKLERRVAFMCMYDRVHLWDCVHACTLCGRVGMICMWLCAHTCVCAPAWGSTGSHVWGMCGQTCPCGVRAWVAVPACAPGPTPGPV